MGKWMARHRVFLSILILTLIFVILKFSGVVAMHWIWMLSPLWMPTLLSIIAAFVLWMAS